MSQHPEFTTPAGPAWPAGEGESVLLFGGTFDPPHLGHVAPAVQARDAVMPGAWLVYVPAGRNPLKQDGPVASGDDRVRMLRIATRAIRRVAVWTLELDRGGPSYWIDTVRAAGGAAGGAALRFLIGADQAGAFHRWRAHEEILDIAQPVVVPRGPIATSHDLERELARTGAWAPAAIARWLGWFQETEMVPAAATDIRRGSAEGIDPAVLAYIRARGLYPP